MSATTNNKSEDSGVAAAAAGDKKIAAEFGAFVERLKADDAGGPVVMLNLLQFVPVTGRKLYFEYIAKTAPLLEAVGGRVLYAGDGSSPFGAPEPATHWDAVALVEYPNRAAFLAMISDKRYEELGAMRAKSVRAAVLQPTQPLVLPKPAAPTATPAPAATAAVAAAPK